MPVKQLIRHFSCWCLVGEFQCGRSEPVDIDNGNEAVGKDTPNRRIGLKSFELTHESGLRFMHDSTSSEPKGLTDSRCWSLPVIREVRPIFAFRVSRELVSIACFLFMEGVINPLVPENEQ
jgi:hypothetical protein